MVAVVEHLEEASSEARIRPLTPPLLRECLTRCARFVQRRETKIFLSLEANLEVNVPVNPSRADVARAVATLEDVSVDSGNRRLARQHR